MSITARSDQ